MLEVPFFVPLGEDADLVLTPMLMSRQGVLARGDLTWRLPEWQGVIEVQASGVYQLDPGAFATAKVPARDWRGAIQTSGRFTPAENWQAGWSYTAFTDNAYLKDYALTDADNAVNGVYATHLSRDTWFDARIQRFNRIGDYTATDEQRQGMNLPKVRFDHVTELAPGWGRVHVTGEVLGVHREADQTRTVNTRSYVYGYEGDKAHAMIEGAWENQVVLPGGVTATPYLGARLDGTWYDRTTGALPAPYTTAADAVLFSATPIAALDMRWPLMARAGDSTHLVEPVAQLVYRGSDTTAVGITNDDAHSFVFDTSICSPTAASRASTGRRPGCAPMSAATLWAISATGAGSTSSPASPSTSPASMRSGSPTRCRWAPARGWAAARSSSPARAAALPTACRAA